MPLDVGGAGRDHYQKRVHDAAGALPPMNGCWFAARVIEVRRAYGLPVDRRERDALARTLAGCEGTEIDINAPGAAAEISRRRCQAAAARVGRPARPA